MDGPLSCCGIVQMTSSVHLKIDLVTNECVEAQEQRVLVRGAY